MQIILNDREQFIARCLAKWRMNDSANAGYKPYAGAERTEEIDTIGAAGEIAVAKALNLYPGFTVGSFKLPDVGCLQVRATKYANGHLIIRPNDKDEDVFVLVTKVRMGKFEAIEIAGWCSGKEAKTMLGDWLKLDYMRVPAWCVAKDKLHPMHTLKV